MSHPAGESACSTCGGERVVAVSGPDYFGQYETDDCPDCAIPINDEAPAPLTRPEA